jgi:predicted secreted protein
MQIKQKTISKRHLALSVVIALLLVAVGGYFVYAATSNNAPPNSAKSDQTQRYDKASDEEKDAGQQAKDETVEESDVKNPSSPSPSASSSPTVPIQITASAQNGSVYQIRVLINSVVSESTCTLVLEQGNSRVTKTASTQTLAQTSTCQGFDVPTSELSLGTWKTTISLSGSSQGSVTGEIEVR